jgi:transcriptional regulator of aromatic amino acid metabolism
MSEQFPEADFLLDDFYDQLQDTVVEQARRLINHDLYTKAILSTLPIALVATDGAGRIRSANRAAEELLCLAGLEQAVQLAGCFPQDQLLQEKIVRCLEAGEGSTLDSHSLVTEVGDQSVVNIYLQPLRDDEKELCGLLIALEDQTYISFLQDSVQRYGSPLQPGPVVADSKPMMQVMARVAELGGGAGPVLLTGESGCGKTFIARQLHDAAGHASSVPYFVIDCRTLTDKDPREFLFGSGGFTETGREEIRFRSVHDYGAIHLADGGSLVLQHVDALPLDAQQAIFEYLQQDQSGSMSNVQARLMATCCSDLKQLAEADEFHHELAELLLVNNLKLPSLWERRKDILPLAQLFLQEAISKLA